LRWHALDLEKAEAAVAGMAEWFIAYLMGGVPEHWPRRGQCVMWFAAELCTHAALMQVHNQLCSAQGRARWSDLPHSSCLKNADFGAASLDSLLALLSALCLMSAVAQWGQGNLPDGGHAMAGRLKDLPHSNIQAGVQCRAFASAPCYGKRPSKRA
jgi:hypothetical protein